MSRNSRWHYKHVLAYPRINIESFLCYGFQGYPTWYDQQMKIFVHRGPERTIHCDIAGFQVFHVSIGNLKNFWLKVHFYMFSKHLEINSVTLFWFLDRTGGQQLAFLKMAIYISAARWTGRRPRNIVQLCSLISPWKKIPLPLKASDSLSLKASQRILTNGLWLD